MGWSDADALGVGESSQGMDANAVGSGLGGGSSGSNSIIDAIRNTFSAYAPQGIANAWNTASLLGRKNALASPTNVDLNAQREMDRWAAMMPNIPVGFARQLGKQSFDTQAKDLGLGSRVDSRGWVSDR